MAKSVKEILIYLLVLLDKSHLQKENLVLNIHFLIVYLVTLVLSKWFRDCFCQIYFELLCQKLYHLKVPKKDSKMNWVPHSRVLQITLVHLR